jgi:hypothetical protein
MNRKRLYKGGLTQEWQLNAIVAALRNKLKSLAPYPRSYHDRNAYVRDLPRRQGLERQLVVYERQLSAVRLDHVPVCG